MQTNIDEEISCNAVNSIKANKSKKSFKKYSLTFVDLANIFIFHIKRGTFALTHGVILFKFNERLPEQIRREYMFYEYILKFSKCKNTKKNIKFVYGAKA